eukprot:233699-Chlamydomonas_euryale.AAC.1
MELWEMLDHIKASYGGHPADLRNDLNNLEFGAKVGRMTTTRRFDVIEHLPKLHVIRLELVKEIVLHGGVVD